MIFKVDHNKRRKLSDARTAEVVKLHAPNANKAEPESAVHSSHTSIMADKSQPDGISNFQNSENPQERLDLRSTFPSRKRRGRPRKSDYQADRPALLSAARKISDSEPSKEHLDLKFTRKSLRNLSADPSQRAPTDHEDYGTNHQTSESKTHKTSEILNEGLRLKAKPSSKLFDTNALNSTTGPDNRQLWPSGKPKGRPRKTDAYPLNTKSQAIADQGQKRKRGRPPKSKPNELIDLTAESTAKHKPRAILKKLSLRFATEPAKAVVTNPMHLPPAPLHNSIDEYLRSFVSLDEDLSLADAKAKSDKAAALRLRIGLARSSGRLNHDSAPRKQIDARPAGPVVSVNHQDKLNEHALNFSILMSKEKRRNKHNARKISSMIQQHFKKLATAGDRSEQEHLKASRKLAKRTINEVQQKWKLAEKEVRRRVLMKLQDEQRAEGKEQLNSILEQSTSLLMTRMASSQHENSDGSSSVEDDDHYLSVEELRRKYADIPDIRETFHSDSGSDNASDSVNHNLSTAVKPSAQLTGDEISDVSEDVLDSELDSPSSTNSDQEDGPGLSSLYPELSRSEQPDLSTDVLEDDTGTESGKSEKVDDQLPETKAVTDAIFRGLRKAASRNEHLDFAHQNADEDETLQELQSDGVSLVDDDSPMDSEDDLESNEDDNDSTEEGPGLAWLYTNPMPSQKAPAQIVAKKPDVPGPALPGTGLNTTPHQSSCNSPSDHDIKTPIPALLRGNLRVYQHAGLDWLAGMYSNGTNGILADEMGLGKTIQTISLLAWLACERRVWGPHLIVVPTSVMLNWEMEFKKFAPGMKILTYYGTPKERKEKRRGWSKANSFHVIITSYQLVIHDAQAFRRKAWEFMILDEAHNIKNFKSQRWQTLLRFNTRHRLLLTGTPLQNNLNELWSLLYFLMPQGFAGTTGFASLSDFQEWFARPVDRLIEEGSKASDVESRETIAKLHRILRPYILRRLKADVEKQMPGKYEHVIECRLSNRQRFLYDDFMSRSNTRAVMASGNFLSIINCFMQLRKVCNHPDLFESRPVVTSLALYRAAAADYQIKALILRSRLIDVDRSSLLDRFDLFQLEFQTRRSCLDRMHFAHTLVDDLLEQSVPETSQVGEVEKKTAAICALRAKKQRSLRRFQSALSQCRSNRLPVYGLDLRRALSMAESSKVASRDIPYALAVLRPAVEDIVSNCQSVVSRFSCRTPKVLVITLPRMMINSGLLAKLKLFQSCSDVSHDLRTSTSIAFPDKRLLQYDCGKLQMLDSLLRELIGGGHRILIFTQMTKMLDILEQFLNIHGHRYFRLDGATKIESRQTLTERFNTDVRIPIFILSTRSGGLGINLTGADCVIFYDSDWNPCMDRQCQDRAHRIGQTRDVHIYRFVSEHTIEQNIMRKANQKRMLDNVVIGEGDFTTDFFNKVDWKDMIGEELASTIDHPDGVNLEKALAAVEDQDDARAAREAQHEMDVDAIEFSEAAAQNQIPEVAQIQDSSVKTASNVESEENVGSVDDYMIRFLEREWCLQV